METQGFEVWIDSPTQIISDVFLAWVQGLTGKISIILSSYSLILSKRNRDGRQNAGIQALPSSCFARNHGSIPCLQFFGKISSKSVNAVPISDKFSSREDTPLAFEQVIHKILQPLTKDTTSLMTDFSKKFWGNLSHLACERT